MTRKKSGKKGRSKRAVEPDLIIRIPAASRARILRRLEAAGPFQLSAPQPAGVLVAFSAGNQKCSVITLREREIFHGADCFPGVFRLLDRIADGTRNLKVVNQSTLKLK